MQLAEEIAAQELKEKEILIEGLLGRGDLVAFGGRRKNGKTTLLFNLAFSLASEGGGFMGHAVTRPCKVIMVLLEDSEGNCQKKTSSMMRFVPPKGRIGIINQANLARAGIRRASVDNAEFKLYVRGRCGEFGPDVIILDNLSRLVNGQYNDSAMVDKAITFAQDLALEFGCAVVIAAHLRKMDKMAETTDSQNLLKDRDAFFEDLMGSSHLINSVDSLWGIAIKSKEERTNYFLGGMQRYTGEEHLSLMLLSDDEQFVLVDDLQAKKLLVVNTAKRREAWNELGGGPWTALDAQRRVNAMSKQAFYPWWDDLVRNGLVRLVEGEEEREIWEKTIQ